jgi:hypothetical protein
MAHVRHRGMGGSRVRNSLDNVAWLCVPHHDLLDGRVGVTSHRQLMNEMLTAQLAYARRAFVTKEESWE